LTGVGGAGARYGPRMLKSSFAVAAMLVLLGAAPAGAAQPSSAQRFADAVLRAKIALRELAPQYQAAQKATFRTCESGIEPDEDPPPHARRRAEVLAYQAELTPFVQVLRPVFDRLLADLRAIPTRDPALRSGREGWRLRTELFFGEPVLPGACEQLAAWVATGYARDKAPAFRVADFMRPEAEDDRLMEQSREKLERATIRMYRLGVSEGEALRFMGHQLFDVLVPEDESGGQTARASARASATTGAARGSGERRAGR